MHYPFLSVRHNKQVKMTSYAAGRVKARRRMHGGLFLRHNGWGIWLNRWVSREERRLV